MLVQLVYTATDASYTQQQINFQPGVYDVRLEQLVLSKSQQASVEELVKLDIQQLPVTSSSTKEILISTPTNTSDYVQLELGRFLLNTNFLNFRLVATNYAAIDHLNYALINLDFKRVE